MKGSEFITERALRDLRGVHALSNEQKAKALRSRLSKYGLTITEYDAMRATANYCCQICRKHESELPNGLVVDHHRDNGFPRGLLCIGCNSALGIFKADVNALTAAMQYLKAAE
jgi:Recombination endonuclease VII